MKVNYSTKVQVPFCVHTGSVISPRQLVTNWAVTMLALETHGSGEESRSEKGKRIEKEEKEGVIS